MSRALLTDLYEVNMAASYLRRGMRDPATFSLFVRGLPADRGYLVAAGLEDCLAALERFRFDEEDLGWMASAGFTDDDLSRLARLRFTGDVWAVPEGRIVLPGEPLLEVTAPLPEAQVVETLLLNQVTFQTALATKATRCVLAATPIDLVEFSLRRTHGTEAGLAMARVSAIAGFVGTSNVEAARRFGLQAMGTMAHSYIEAFPSERDAFRAFATDLPGRPLTFLVDTYDTLRGVDAAIDVIRELHLDEAPGTPLAVRLDSGDLAVLARESRARLDAAGLPEVGIFVSGSLDEFRLGALRSAGAPVDAAGVGTRAGVSADAPYLDTAYKLVALDGRPVAKLSTGKQHHPGAKQVWRRLDDPGRADVLAGRGEAEPPGTEPLLVPVMGAGRRIGTHDTLPAARARLERDLPWLLPEALRLHDPVPPPLDVTPALEAALADVVARMAPAASSGDGPTAPHGTEVR